MHTYNVLDVVVAVAIVGAILLGYYRGFVAQLVSIAGFVAAYLVAYWLYDDLAAVLARTLPLHSFKAIEQYAFLIEGLNVDRYLYNAISFAFLFIITKVGLTIVGRILHLVTKVPGVRTVNKAAGALLALIEAVLLIVIGVHVMSVLPSESVQKLLADSRSAAFIMEHMPDAMLKLKELWSTTRS